MAQISSKKEENALIISVDGRVDTTNAGEVQEKLLGICNENEFEELLLDAEKLQYISSAGLRVVLALKKAHKNFKVINTSPEVYDIFDMTGFTEMMDISKAYRQFSVDGCKIIGQGAKGIVYRYNPDTIVKVYKSNDDLPAIHKERELARKAFVLGIPTAISYDIVRVGESYGSVFELLDAKSLSECIAEDSDNLEAYVDEFVTMLKTIHSTVADNVLPSVKNIPHRWMSTVVNYIPEDQAKRLNELIDAVPDIDNMVHCDYHTNNVMMQNGEAILIDMDTISRGDPIFELSNVYTTYVGFGFKEPENVERFLGIKKEIASKFWELFLPKYMGTDNKEVLDRVRTACELLCSVRLIRHTSKRKDITDEFKNEIIEDAKQRIAENLPKVTSLAYNTLI